jgi:hypothetical protein
MASVRSRLPAILFGLRRLVVLAGVLGMSGCITYTSHQLPIAGTAAADLAKACEAACRADDTTGTREAYALCLDDCPGAVRVEDAQCPIPPKPGWICAQTARTERSSILAGVLISMGVLFGLLLAASRFSLPQI